MHRHTHRTDRRGFLQLASAGALAMLSACRDAAGQDRGPRAAREEDDPDPAGRRVELFLAGDVMLARGIDQILPHSVEPTLYEPYIRSAKGYVRLAEDAHGPIPRPVDFDYVWGDALEALGRQAPDACIVNLETAVTTHDEPAEKGIHYRMHPGNVPVLTAAGVDCCVLANNHVLDWGRPGLEETLRSLQSAGLVVAGAGRDLEAAQAPGVVEVRGGRRVLVFAWARPTSGVPPSWAATGERSGVSYLPDLSDATVDRIGEQVRRHARPGDVVVASIHWGGNWGYEVPEAHRRFAHGLVERAGVHVVHGHSSHHPKGVEVHEGHPILYGSGDFLNDYEGISGHREYRPDLVLGYLPTLDPETGRLVRLEMVPFRIRRMRLERARAEDVAWLHERMDRESRKLGTRVRRTSEGTLVAA